MDKIREKVASFMEHNDVLSKLKGENWYNMEDELVNLVCEISGLRDATYISQCEKASCNEHPTSYEEDIYSRVDRYHHRQDMLYAIEKDQEERNWEGVPRLVYTDEDIEKLTDKLENKITGEENYYLAHEVLLDYQDEHTFDETV
ncbi:MAG: hypothetical protein IJE43_03185 [Alphaproteobacteria bacterium]|nr:hypothetical protein [Alphaproteobacteria bacterium]